MSTPDDDGGRDFHPVRLVFYLFFFNAGFIGVHLYEYTRTTLHVRTALAAHARLDRELG